MIRLRTVAAEIQAAFPKWRVLVERGYSSTDRKLTGTRLRHGGKGRWGTRVRVWDEHGCELLDFNNAETYRTNDEVVDWLNAQLRVPGDAYGHGTRCTKLKV